MKFILTLALAACVTLSSFGGGLRSRWEARREARAAQTKAETVVVKESAPVTVTTEKTYKLTGTKTVITPATTESKGKAKSN